MNSFWDTVLATPFHYIEMLIAFLAALSFLVYLRGFLGSVGNIVRISGHEEHVEHAQVRVIWGLYLLIFLFVFWEILRTIAIWLGFQDGDPSLGLWLAGIIAVVWVLRFIKKNLFAGGGGGH
jgi:uncharacterized membrane protein